MTTSSECPAGFHMSRTAGQVLIHFRRAALGALGWFLVVFVVLWTSACVWVLVRLYQSWVANGIGGALAEAAWAGLVGYGEIVAGLFLARRLYDRTKIALGVGTLIVEHTSLGRTRKRECPRSQIGAVRQVRDGGSEQEDVAGNITAGHEDSFLTYGLVLLVNAQEPIDLLRRQSEDDSTWLGGIIADWAGRPYVRSAL